MVLACRRDVLPARGGSACRSAGDDRLDRRRSRSSVRRWMRASRRRSHHSSVSARPRRPGGSGRAARRPRPRAAASAALDVARGDAEVRRERGRGDRADEAEPRRGRSRRARRRDRTAREPAAPAARPRPARSGAPGHTAAASERRSAATQKAAVVADAGARRVRPRRSSSRSRATRQCRRRVAARAARPGRAAGRAARRRRADRAAPPRPPRRWPPGRGAPRSSATCGGQAAAQRDGAGAALLERRVVEEGVGVRVQDLVREHARARASRASRARISPARIAREHGAQAVDVHRLVQAVAHRLAHERVVGHLDGAAAPWLSWQASWRREDRGEQVVGAHALERRRHASCRSAKRSSASERRGVPAPARLEHRRLERGLVEHLLERRSGCSSSKTASSGKLCCGPSESSTPSSVAAACSSKSKVRQKRLRSARPQARLMRRAEGRVDDELHAARLVEEALGDHACRGWAPRRARRAPPRRSRARAAAPRAVERAGLALEPRDGARRRRATARRPRSPRAARRPRPTARGCAPGASPSQNGMVGGAPCASSTRTRPLSTRRMRHEVLPSRKTSPAMRLDGEVLVDRADLGPVGLQHDVVVGVVGDGAAGGERGQARAAAAPQLPVDARRGAGARPAAAAGGDALGEHVDHLRRSSLAASVGVRRGAAARARRARPRPAPRRRTIGDDLLGEDVERRVAEREPRRARRGGPRAASAAHSTSWSRVSGKSRPFGRGAAGRGRSGRRAGARSRSSAASRAGRRDRPRRRRCRARARRWRPPPRQLARLEPLLGVEAARARTGCRGARRPRSSPSRSPRWRATRSTRRRVLTNTSVERCSRASAAMRS